MWNIGSKVLNIFIIYSSQIVNDVYQIPFVIGDLFTMSISIVVFTAISIILSIVSILTSLVAVSV